MKNGPYTLLVPPERYPGKKYRSRYAYEHHIVWWKHSGALVPQGYEIHHINGDHRDNTIKNLKLVSASEHREIHGKLRSQKALIIRKCAGCSKEFKIKGSFLRTRLKTSKRIFCKRSCYAKPPITLTCAYCGISFKRNSPIKRKNYFCCQIHGGLFQSAANKKIFRVGEIGITADC